MSTNICIRVYLHIACSSYTHTHTHTHTHRHSAKSFLSTKSLDAISSTWRKSTSSAIGERRNKYETDEISTKQIRNRRNKYEIDTKQILNRRNKYETEIATKRKPPSCKRGRCPSVSHTNLLSSSRRTLSVDYPNATDADGKQL